MKRLILFLTVASSLCLQAQTNGYFGKRVLTEFSIAAGADYRDCIEFHSDYIGTDKKIKPDLRFNIGAGYVLSNNVAIGCEIGFTQTKASFYSLKTSAFADTSFAGTIIYSSKNFCPYIEWHNRTPYPVIDNYFRLGLCMSIITNSKYKEFYIYNWDLYSSIESEFYNNLIALKTGQKATLPGIYYEFGNRVPLSHNILLFIAASGYIMPFRSNIYSYFKSAHFSNSLSNTYIEDYGKRRVANSNFVKLNFGIAWML